MGYERGDWVRTLKGVPEGIEVSFYQVVQVDGNTVSFARPVAPTALEQKIGLILDRLNVQSMDDMWVVVDADGIGVINNDTLLEPDEDNLHNQFVSGTVIPPAAITDEYRFEEDLSANRGEGHGNAF